MSGALGFIRANPTTQGFDAMDARLERTRRRDEAEATDAAIRDGVGQMLQPGPAPGAAPAPPPPSPPPAPAPAAATSAAPAGSAPPAAPPPAAAAAPAPMAPPSRPSAPPANPYRPVLDRLVGTPGAGATALNLLQRGESEVTRRQLAASRGLAADARTRTASERNILYALGRGEVDVARFLGSQIGMEIPEEILQDSRARTRFAAASLVAQRQYGNDPDQAVVFVQEYLRSGDPQAALRAAGVPRGRAAGWRPEWVLRDNQEVLMFFNPNTRQTWTPGDPASAPPGAAPAPQGATPTPAAPAAPPAAAGATPAQPNFVTRAPRAGNTARPSAIAERERVLQLAGYSPQEAAQIAGGAYLTENQRAQAWVRLRQNIEQQVTETREPQRGRAITAALDAARRDFDAVFPPMPRPGAAQPARPADPAAPPPPPAPPPAPARPAAPAAAPRPPVTGIPQRPLGVPAGSAWSAQGQRWRDPQGLFYDAAGNPVDAAGNPLPTNGR